jgi:hypothetical protein
MKKHLYLAMMIILLLSQTGMGKDALAVRRRQQVVAETMKPYEGPSVTGVNTSTLAGKVMCGYQDWHAASHTEAKIESAARLNNSVWNRPIVHRTGQEKLQRANDYSNQLADQHATLR